MTPSRWFCPTCGRGFTMRGLPTRTPTCEHQNTPRAAMRPALMKLDETEMMEGEG